MYGLIGHKGYKHDIVQKQENKHLQVMAWAGVPCSKQGFNKNQNSNLKNNNPILGNNHGVTFQLETVL